ncbi:hypothetical protein ERL59_06610 [Chengkuizengella sp. YPA3-1-1]|uniref:Replication-relaxation n=2 Tax=Chengkuizengella marina TaxID=2507566 RepID=A0A6N9Q1D4_9BACL|nr:hypothetical protein [Chengkuizengella marina]
MGRDDIIDLHFSNLKDPVTQCNRTMKRLIQGGYVIANKDHRKYIYLPRNGIKYNSLKIPHFLSIVRFYIEINFYEKPKEFIVEPKYKKGFMEPDIFMIWKSSPFFVEIQRNIYSKKTIGSKLKRYENYYNCEKWKNEYWQPKNKKVFPTIWFITQHQYNLNAEFRIIQTKNAKEILKQA